MLPLVKVGVQEQTVPYNESRGIPDSCVVSQHAVRVGETQVNAQ